MDKHLLLDTIAVILCEILRELWVTILTQRGTEKAQRNTAFSNLLLFCFQRIFSFVKKLVLQFTNCFIGFYLLNHFHQLRNCFVNQQFPGLCGGFGTIAAVMVRVAGVPPDAGASNGALLAFMIAGPGTSLGVIGGLMLILKRRLLWLYLGYIFIGAIVLGYLTDWLL